MAGFLRGHLEFGCKLTRGDHLDARLNFGCIGCPDTDIPKIIQHD